jgi:hypothetical protein
MQLWTTGEQMDRQQLLIIGARHELGAALRAAQKRRPWHYALNGVSDHELTLASLIVMTSEQTERLLLVCGLSRKKWRPSSSGGLQEVGFYSVVSPDAWEAFAVDQNLKAGYFYFDRHKVKQYTGADTVYWVGIGCSASQPSVNPKSQFELFKTPPRLSGKESREVRSFSKKVMLMLELHDQTTTEDAQDEGISGDATQSGQVKQPSEQEERAKAQSDDNVRLIATNLLERIASGTLDVVDGTCQLVTMMRTVKYEEQGRRLKPVMVDLQPVSELEELKASDLNKSSYPILTDLGLPLSPVFLSALLRELVMLSRNHPQRDMLTYSTHRGTTCRLLSIPKSSSEYRFQRNSKQWLKTLLEDSTGCGDASKGALWISKVLASQCEVEFIEAAEDAGYPILSVKMDEETAAAMWFESNTLKKNSRTILAYLKQAYGTRFVLPQSQIEEKLGVDHLVPDCGTWVNNKKETIHYWTKAIDEVRNSCFWALSSLRATSTEVFAGQNVLFSYCICGCLLDTGLWPSGRMTAKTVRAIG